MRAYGIIGGMQKTTVYLPENLKRELRATAARDGLSEAELIRGALAAALRVRNAPRPRFPLGDSGDPRLAQRVAEGEGLDGFGQR